MTEAGLRKYQDVVDVVKVFFHYIALLQKSSPQEWIFKELATLADQAFRFKEKTAAIKFTKQTSQVMQTSVPRAWLLRGNM